MATERAILTEDDFSDIVGDKNIEHYVETGTLEGEQLEIAARVFPTVEGIEIDEHYAKLSSERVPSARLLNADSRDALSGLAGMIHSPVLWFLDAHYCHVEPPIEPVPFPLWDELFCLRSRRYPDIVVVDDVHTFGRKRDDIRYGEAIEWEGVTQESISSVLGAPLGRVVKDCYVVVL